MSEVKHNFVAKLKKDAKVAIGPQLNIGLNNYTQLINRLSLANLLIGLPLFYTFYTAGKTGFALSILPLIGLFACIILINKKGHLKLSRSVLLSAINVSIFIYAAALGKAAQIENIFLFTLIMPLLFFHIHEVKWILFCVLQPVLLWAFLNLTGYHSVSMVDSSQESIYLAAQFIRVVYAALFFYATYSILSLNQKSADKLVGEKESAQRAQAKTEKFSKEKSKFLAVMSHELRTPLNGIIGAVQLLENNSDPQLHHKYTQLISSSSELLLTLINDNLDFEKISAGKMPLLREPFNIIETIQETLDLIRPSLEQKGLQLILGLDPSCPDQLIGDSMRIKQVLLNLLSNACKFTQDGDIRVKLAVVEKSNPQIKLCISVHDTGIGISQENLKKIFLPYLQAENILQRNAGGTGLGLAIGQRFAKLMQGKIVVESKLGEGSTFRFFLQLLLPSPAEKLKSQERAVKVPMHFPQYTAARVLVVEDDLINQKVVQMLLGKFGIVADLAENGQMACEMRQTRDYDIVFMDCSMPIMDGFQATELFRQFERDKKKTPTIIIAFTGNSSESDKARCLSSGMNDFIVKPTKIEALACILNKYLPIGQ